MKKIIVLSLIAYFAFSCSDIARLERREDRLIGAWVFEKAFFKEDGALFRDNIIREFEGDIIEFFGDYSAIYDDYSLGAAFWGEWELFADRFDNDGDRDLEFFLDMSFYDDINREEFGYFCNVLTLTNNRLHVKAHSGSGVYTFKLRPY